MFLLFQARFQPKKPSYNLARFWTGHFDHEMHYYYSNNKLINSEYTLSLPYAKKKKKKFITNYYIFPFFFFFEVSKLISNH